MNSRGNNTANQKQQQRHLLSCEQTKMPIDAIIVEHFINACDREGEPNEQMSE